MNDLKKTIMEMDGSTEEEAQIKINEAKDELNDRLADGQDCFDFCEEYFGLEPDYLIDLIS